jgi:methionyl-tRNA formyltransferase
MNVLLLGGMPSLLRPIVEKTNCIALETEEKISVDFLQTHSVDFVVSYRYRHIILKDIIDYLKGQIINLHISLLPWNRGADPNLWSFLEDTPKGVTIHVIDAGIDTGDIIAQRSVAFDLDHETLKTTYDKLNHDIIQLFSEYWQLIKGKEVAPKKQPAGGTFHRTADKAPYSHLLREKGWATPVKELIGRALATGKERFR